MKNVFKLLFAVMIISVSFATATVVEGIPDGVSQTEISIATFSPAAIAVDNTVVAVDTAFILQNVDATYLDVRKEKESLTSIKTATDSLTRSFYVRSYNKINHSNLKLLKHLNHKEKCVKDLVTINKIDNSKVLIPPLS